MDLKSMYISKLNHNDKFIVLTSLTFQIKFSCKLSAKQRLKSL